MRLDKSEFYMSHFNIDQKMDFENKHYEIALSQTYFAFTSLSTIGLGDFHPRSEHERARVAPLR